MKAGLVLLVASLCLTATAIADDVLVSSGTIAKGTPFTEKNGTYQQAQSGLQIGLPQRFSAFGLRLSGTDWSPFTHIQVQLQNTGPSASVMTVVVDSGTSGWMGSDFVVAPGTTRTVVIPLGATNGSLPDYWPSLADGSLQTPCWGTIDKSNVRMVRVWNATVQGPVNALLKNLKAVTLTPRTSGILDIYGQQTISFANKITSNAQLVTMGLSDSTDYPGVLPYNNDAYNGLAGSNFTTGTGKWRTAKQNGKWYIITPTGDRFFSTGVNCAGAGASAQIAGHESMFTALPDPNVFFQHYTHYVNPATGQPDPGIDFYTANAQIKWGSNWRPFLSDSVARRMRTWGFNTVTTVSMSELYEPTSGLATMPGISIGGNFKTVYCASANFAMPDVYDPAWAAAVKTQIAGVVPTLNDNPNNVGLFVDNELPWAFHWENANYRYSLAFDILKAPANQPAKLRLVANLVNKYRTIARLNTAWATSFASFDALKTTTNFTPGTVNAAMAADIQTFLTQFANLYFSTIKSALVSSNYKGLYLGCRFLYYGPEVLAAAKRYCDVISFNAYDLTPSGWRGALKSLDAPVLISEFGLSAADLGRVGGFYPCGVIEADRISAYRRYVSDAMTWNNLVGMHWYKWEDDPASGRQWDNQNHSLGLVSIADVPYTSFLQTVTDLNTQLNSRLINP